METVTGVRTVGLLQDGKTAIDAEHLSSVAKYVEFEDGKKRYFVKVGVDGGIFNPYGIYSAGTQHLSARRNGMQIWKYREVSEKCYSFYINFLQSRNPRNLHYAERELKNG